MSSDVVLSAALRNNLLSLQGTQSQIDKTQLQLSTGKKVNSALDNPQEYFQSQALTNRANDLSALLDGIGQSIEVIKAANNGVTALTSLVNEAQATAQSAQTAVAGGTQVAAATGTASLNGSTLLSSISGLTAAGGDAVEITVTDPATGSTVLNGTTATGNAKAGKIVTTATSTVNDLVNSINDLNSTSGTGGNTPLSSPAISASLDSSGHLQITATNGGQLNVRFVNAGAASDSSSLGVATALGFGTTVKTNAHGVVGAAATDTIDFTASASASITSKAVYTAANTIAQSTSLISGLKDVTGATTYTSLAATNTLTVTVGGKTSADLLHYTNGSLTTTGTTATVQSVIDAINHDSNVDNLVSASFNTSTGQISLTALDASSTDISFSLGNAAGATAQSFNLFGTQGLATTAAANTVGSEDVRFGAAAGQLASLQTQYNTTLSQIDALVKNGDTGYQGVNLLNGDNLVTTFNETRTSSLTTSGANFTSSGLGLKSANFGSASGVTSSLNQISSALTTVRNFGSGLANDLATIQTRQTFVNSTISTLQEGSDNLTNADTNAAGATLLALQTRQSLGVTALSLASQSAQSVLRLFQ